MLLKNCPLRFWPMAATPRRLQSSYERCSRIVPLQNPLCCLSSEACGAASLGQGFGMGACWSMDHCHAASDRNRRGSQKLTAFSPDSATATVGSRTNIAAQLESERGCAEGNAGFSSSPRSAPVKAYPLSTKAYVKCARTSDADSAEFFLDGGVLMLSLEK